MFDQSLGEGCVTSKGWNREATIAEEDPKEKLFLLAFNEVSLLRCSQSLSQLTEVNSP